MKKHLCVLVALLLAATWPLPGRAEQRTPEALVRDFYVWYGVMLHGEPRVDPLREPAMLAYVHGSTVERLRRDYDKIHVDADYFTKGQDYWPEMFQQMAVSKAIPVTPDVCILSVTLESNVRSAPELVVFLQRGPAGWRISKVESIYYHLER